jgi:hypothetical protein
MRVFRGSALSRCTQPPERIRIAFVRQLGCNLVGITMRIISLRFMEAGSCAMPACREDGRVSPEWCYATFISGSRCWCCWADWRCSVGSVDSNSTTERVCKAAAVGGCETSPQTAIAWYSLRLRRRSMARGSGGPDQTGGCRDISGGRVVADGSWSLPRALGCACISSWHGTNRI